MSSRLKTLLATLSLGLALAASGQPVAAAPEMVVPLHDTAATSTVLPTATPAPSATPSYRPVPMPMPKPPGTACFPFQASAPARNWSPAASGATIAVTAFAVAPAADTQRLPRGAKTDFARGESVCIAYTLTNANPGDSIDFRYFHNGKVIPFNGTSTTFERGFASRNEVSEFSRPAAGSYRIELFLNGATTPSRAITFTVR